MLQPQLGMLSHCNLVVAVLMDQGGLAPDFGRWKIPGVWGSWQWHGAASRCRFQTRTC